MELEMMDWIFTAMGIFLMLVGIIIWAGKKIDLVHGDEASKVQSEDVKPYARLLGIGVMLMGLGVSLYGFFGAFSVIHQYVQYIALALLCGGGLLIVYIGHKKYFKGEL